MIAWVGGVPLRRYVGSSSYLSQDSHRVHIGIGAANKIDRLEVRWLRGGTETWTNIAPNHFYDVTQGDLQVKPFTGHGNEVPAPTVPAPLDRAMLLRFWEKQHAAMDAMKREHDYAKAARLFREALAINPGHEDSHYYLANCLAVMAEVPAAIVELDALARINPQNHRAFQRKGELLAASASSKGQLQRAREPLQTAQKMNSEETGTLVLIGELALAMGDYAGAERELAHASVANPRASNVWFLRGYIAWKRRDVPHSRDMLIAAGKARGPDWKPVGSVMEGDVRRRMYTESGFLNVFEQEWNGSADPAPAYGPLDNYLRRFR